ncbi:cobalamin-dependent protein [Dactylosporangium sp. CS-047395]|uniref:cobalamin-dependent protein n=1 Tax=Dactylosporangium sp. CS-047395 TaxID=3239936 RepID=UPI003D8ABDBE
MSSADLVLILRYRKAVTYGHHVLLAALEEHPTDTRYEVVFAESAAATVEAIKAAHGAGKVLVLWSFYSPDAAALAEELAAIKEQAPGAVHVAGGVHATAEPVRTLDAGWDIAAVGEGESTLLNLVDQAGDPTGIQGLVYRDEQGTLHRTGKAHREPLGTYRAFPVTYKRMNPIEITRGCVYACAY